MTQFAVCRECGEPWPLPHKETCSWGYDYEADIARGSNIRRPGERPWEAAQRMRREREERDA